MPIKQKENAVISNLKKILSDYYKFRNQKEMNAFIEGSQFQNI